jgi:hypothetical protein
VHQTARITKKRTIFQVDESHRSRCTAYKYKIDFERFLDYMKTCDKKGLLDLGKETIQELVITILGILVTIMKFVVMNRPLLEHREDRSFHSLVSCLQALAYVFQAISNFLPLSQNSLPSLRQLT